MPITKRAKTGSGVGPRGVIFQIRALRAQSVRRASASESEAQRKGECSRLGDQDASAVARRLQRSRQV